MRLLFAQSARLRVADTREAALAQIAATTAICQRMRNEPTMPEADLQLSVASAAGLAAGTALLGTRRRARRATLGRCEPRRRAPPAHCAAAAAECRLAARAQFFLA